MLSHPRIRSALIQILLLAVLAVTAWYIYQTTRTNIIQQRIATGFDFFWVEAGFSINQALIPYSEASNYFRAFLVGLLNTLLVSALGLVFATAVSFGAGIGRLSSTWVVAQVCGTYVEVVRNLPLLFQIVFWYLVMIAVLPAPRESVSVFGEAFINRRGFFFPKPIFSEGAGPFLRAVLAALFVAWALGYFARRQRVATGRSATVWPLQMLALIGIPLAAWLALGMTVSVEHPVLKGMNFTGGLQLIPEFVALLFALSTYTAAFIAEIVRAGILAVRRGQSEAALALGLSRRQSLRLVVVPQALRVIVPPLTSQYLNLIKNSSLAVAIGYPDLVSVFAGTTLTNRGQAIEIIAITMLVYLAISLIVSFAMNLYNRRIALTGQGARA